MLAMAAAAVACAHIRTTKSVEESKKLSGPLKLLPPVTAPALAARRVTLPELSLPYRNRRPRAADCNDTKLTCKLKLWLRRGERCSGSSAASVRHIRHVRPFPVHLYLLYCAYNTV